MSLNDEYKQKVVLDLSEFRRQVVEASILWDNLAHKIEAPVKVLGPTGTPYATSWASRFHPNNNANISAATHSGWGGDSVGRMGGATFGASQGFGGGTWARSGPSWGPPPGFGGGGGGGGGRYGYLFGMAGDAFRGGASWLGNQASGAASAASSLQQLVGSTAPLVNLFTELAQVGGGLAASLIGASVAAAKFEAQILGLRAVEPNDKAADFAFTRIRDIAKLPGVGLEDALKGFIQLRAANLSEGFTDRVLRAFGKINAIAGGGKEEYGRIVYAVQETANKPYASSQQLFRQMANAGVPVAKLMMEAFGTIDPRQLQKEGISATEALRRLVEVIEKMKDVSAGARNAWDNFNDSLKVGIVGLGTGFNEFLRPVLEDMSSSMDALSAGGGFKSIGEAFAAIGQNNVGGSTDDLMIELVTYAKVTAFGINQLVENAKGLGSWWEGIERWLNSDALHGGRDVRGRSGRTGEDQGVPSIQDMIETYRHETYREMELGKRKIEQARKKTADFEAGTDPFDVLADPSKAPKAGGAAARVEGHLARIAKSTEKMVDLQESIINGTRIGSDLSPIELGGGRRRRGGWESHGIGFDIIGAIEYVIEQSSLHGARSGG